ncbi:putative phosphatase regulatory subunit-domain-containing protein [Irpex rosettiformis]|uniref:Phosphatase regulatory subunit-domain-containing protein n=1 Tax=Irpex rosettiformis TaxID=378272 RepID=A0ACB8ULJ2_9APHY|nr:putative phosphatase regulatory subunit-domain-containing protein [Irpex rosettiformis]
MPYALPSPSLPSSSSSSTATATLPPPTRPGHRRTRSAFSDESGPGAFVSMGSLPRRRASNSNTTVKKPLFHFEDEDSPEESAVVDGPAPGMVSPYYSPTNSLRLSIQSGRFSPSVNPPSHIQIPKPTVASSSLTNAVPFPTSSPVTDKPLSSFIPPSPPHTSSLPRTPSSPIILSNGKPLKSSLKSSSSSPNVAGEFDLSQRKHFRAQSAPSTPRVHFAEKNAGLETVKVFNKGGKPASLSKPPGEETETETEAESYPFPLLSSNSMSIALASQQLLHEIDNTPYVTSAIPNLSPAPRSNVLLETITLPRTRPPTLRGTVLVRNLAFEKNVAVRFTLDDWQTTSEVTCKHVVSLPGLPPPFPSESRVSKTVGDAAACLGHEEEEKPAWDRFSFTIRLEDYETKLAERTIYLVARYICPAGEFWDNNDTKNYRVGFRKSAASPLSTPRTQPSTLGNMSFSQGTAGSGVVTSQQRTFSAPSSLKCTPVTGTAAPVVSRVSVNSSEAPRRAVTIFAAPKSPVEESESEVEKTPIEKDVEDPTTQKYISRRLSLSNYVAPTVHPAEEQKVGKEGALATPPTTPPREVRLKELPDSAKEPHNSTSDALSPLIMIGGMPASDVSGPFAPPQVTSFTSRTTAPPAIKTSNLADTNTDADDVSSSALPFSPTSRARFGMSGLGAQFGSLSQLASPPVSRQGSENSTPSSSGRNSPNRKPSPPPTFLRRKESPTRVDIPESTFVHEVNKLSPEEYESQVTTPTPTSPGGSGPVQVPGQCNKVDTSDSSYAAFVRQWCFAQSAPPTPGSHAASPSNSTPPTPTPVPITSLGSQMSPSSFAGSPGFGLASSFGVGSKRQQAWPADQFNGSNVVFPGFGFGGQNGQSAVVGGESHSLFDGVMDAAAVSGYARRIIV